MTQMVRVAQPQLVQVPVPVQPTAMHLISCQGRVVPYGTLQNSHLSLSQLDADSDDADSDEADSDAADLDGADFLSDAVHPAFHAAEEPLFGGAVEYDHAVIVLHAADIDRRRSRGRSRGRRAAARGSAPARLGGRDRRGGLHVLLSRRDRRDDVGAAGAALDRITTHCNRDGR